MVQITDVNKNNSNDRCDALATFSLAAFKRFLSAGWFRVGMHHSGGLQTTIHQHLQITARRRWSLSVASPKRVALFAVAWLMAVAVASWGSAQGPRETAFQTVSGKYITLVSDAQKVEELEQLVASFDAAVPQWAKRLNRSDSLIADFHVKAYLMEQADRFRRSGDLPGNLNFKFGFARNQTVWLFKQPSEYYTRHLLLHEGVHAFCLHQFNGIGPQWFGEGVAEWLALHRGQEAEIVIDQVPATRADTPYWGRFKAMSAARAQGKVPTLDAVLAYPIDRQGNVERYGWSWLAVSLLYHYPDTREAFLDSFSRAAETPAVFNELLKRDLARRWPVVQARWRVAAQQIDYGFQWERETIDLSINDPAWQGQTVRKDIKADQGWQSIGVRLPPGTTVRIDAEGQCTINQNPKPWISEPAGVTIHYANDRPLGQCLACVIPNLTSEKQWVPSLTIQPIDGPKELKIKQYSWLLLRINDHLDDLDNNRGGYRATLQPSN